MQAFTYNDLNYLEHNPLFTGWSKHWHQHFFFNFVLFFKAGNWKFDVNVKGEHLQWFKWFKVSLLFIFVMFQINFARDKPASAIIKTFWDIRLINLATFFIKLLDKSCTLKTSWFFLQRNMTGLSCQILINNFLKLM